jgi:uncharacterized protein YyaL (SSP411 family)
MTSGLRVGGIDKFITSMKNYRKSWFGRVKTEMSVGFSADYAFRIHEDLAMFHTVGQAKFLETAIREIEPTIARQVRDMLKHSYSLESALQAQGLRILSRAQELVPVDTGFLRDSGYVEVR